MSAPFPVTEHVAQTERHTTFYLSCGASDAPLIIFVHGWPELSISWRHQLPCMASLGFRAIAPDMRGYGGSSIHPEHGDYALEPIVQDMLELLASLGAEKAVWVGHDWGSPVVWSLASHHAERCHGVANLCVPYIPTGAGLDSVVPLVDRSIYPEQDYPAGQWEYRAYYEEQFSKARATLESDVAATLTALFRKGNPGGKGKPARTAETRRQGGWFGGADRAPPLPLDTDVISQDDLRIYAEGLERNGFFGPDSWYMNDRANSAYAKRAVDGGRLRMPVLFLHAEYDYTCETVTSRLADPMRAHCDNLSEAYIASGHWMAQEKPVAVNSALVRWLATQLPQLWSPPMQRS
jgi:pimeloyl-ACP methyl ester carboxylesterase